MFIACLVWFAGRHALSLNTPISSCCTIEPQLQILTMPVHIPVYLATMAACGSLVTSVKSSWELSRMVRRKLEEEDIHEEAHIVHRKLRKAYFAGVMSGSEYDKWYEKCLLAKVEKDSMSVCLVYCSRYDDTLTSIAVVEMRKIRAHLRMIWNQPWVDTQISRAHSRRAHSHDRSRSTRQRSVSFDTNRVTFPYVSSSPDSPGTEWHRSAGSIEWYMTSQKAGKNVQLAPLQRRVSVSYPRGHTSSEMARGTLVQEARVQDGRCRSEDPGMYRGRTRFRESSRIRNHNENDRIESRKGENRRRIGS